MSSQHNEDRIVLDYFGEHVGKFLDLGAHSATSISNTRCLAGKGWKGVCVDASPACSAELVKAYRDNPNVMVVQAHIGPGGLVRFWDSLGDAVGSSVKWFIDHWKGNGYTQFTEMYVAGVTLPQLLETFPGPYDLIDIDTEGSSADLFFECFALGYRPRMWIVEEDMQRDKIIDAGKSDGYHVIDVPGNVILAL